MKLACPAFFDRVRRQWVLALAATLFAGAVQAACIADCDARDMARHIVQPIEENSHAVSNGRIWLAAPDLQGRECCSRALLIRVAGSAAYSCAIVTRSRNPNDGWMQVVVLKTRTEALDADRLKVNVPVRIYHSQDQIWDLIELIHDPAAGTIELR